MRKVSPICCNTPFSVPKMAHLLVISPCKLPFNGVYSYVGLLRFLLRIHNVSDLDITGGRKVGAPTFYIDWVLHMVLKKMDLIFILASPILVLTKVVMKYLVFSFLFFETFNESYELFACTV